MINAILPTWVNLLTLTRLATPRKRFCVPKLRTVTMSFWALSGPAISAQTFPILGAQIAVWGVRLASPGLAVGVGLEAEAE